MAPRSVRLSSPERVLFPGEGITKQDVFEYYRAIAPVLVPHLRNRPFTMKRFPYGATGDVYFQKQAPKGMPSWIPTRTFRTYPREGGSRLVDFPLLNSPEGVLWMVQMNCIDMNAWYSRVDKPERPDFVLFDLDPPDGGFALAIRVAHLIREELERAGLESYVKTSGADGMHVLVPIARRATYDQTYTFAERVARGLEERPPGLVTTEWLKRKREGVLRRSPSERAGKDDRLGLLRAAEAGCADLDAASLGRADGGGDAPAVRDARRARAGRAARRPVRARARGRAGARIRPEARALGADPAAVGLRPQRPGTAHIFVGASDGPCAILMAGARLAEERLHYPVSELAARYGASVDEETNDFGQVYPRLEPSRPERPPYCDRLPWAR